MIPATLRTEEPSIYTLQPKHAACQPQVVFGTMAQVAEYTTLHVQNCQDCAKYDISIGRRGNAEDVTLNLGV